MIFVGRSHIKLILPAVILLFPKIDKSKHNSPNKPVRKKKRISNDCIRLFAILCAVIAFSFLSDNKYKDGCKSVIHIARAASSIKTSSGVRGEVESLLFFSIGV